MTTVPDRNTFETAYAGQAPWDIGKPQQAFLDVADRITGSVQQQATHPGGGPPLHRHSREDEGFCVLEGEYEFRVGEQTFRAGPGTFVFGPRGIPHTFKCVGPGPGKIQVIISPPGLEAFFEEVDVLARQGPPDVGKVVALAGKYGVEFLGPPPG